MEDKAIGSWPIVPAIPAPAGPLARPPSPEIARLDLDPLARAARDDARSEPQVRIVQVPGLAPERSFGRIARVGHHRVPDNVGAAHLVDGGDVGPLADAREQWGQIVETVDDDMDHVALALDLIAFGIGQEPPRIERSSADCANMDGDETNVG